MAPKKYQIPAEIEEKMKKNAERFEITQNFLDQVCKNEDIQYGSRLCSRRKELELTQEDLAKFVGRSVECISRIEKGKNCSIDLNLLRVLSYGLNCTPHYLLGLTSKTDETLIYSKDNKLIPLRPAIIFYLDEDLQKLDKKLAWERTEKKTLRFLREWESPSLQSYIFVQFACLNFHFL